MDSKVKQSLARLRRGLISVDWRGERLSPEMRAHGQSGSVDDLLAYHVDALRAANVGWSPLAEAGEDKTTPRWRPTPEMNAFVQRLSSTIDAEGSVLVGLAARARDVARSVALAGARSSVHILDEARSVDPDAWSRQEAFDTIRESLSEIAETALEASLSAVRTGSCARALVRIESGDGEIDAALRHAREEIGASIAAIEDLGARIATDVIDLREAGRLADNARNFAAMIGAHEPQAARSTMAALGGTAEVAAEIAERVADEASELASLVDALSARMIAILRESPAGDRRRSRRIAFNAGCVLGGARSDTPGRIVDISLGGALVDPASTVEFRRGQPLRLVLPDMPAIAASVAGVSPQGVHLSFDLGHAANAQARPPLLRLLGALHQRDDAFVDLAIALASAFGAVLTEALAGDADARGELLAGPPAARVEALLRGSAASLIDATVASSDGVVYAIAMDRRCLVAYAAIAPAWREAATPTLTPAGSLRADATGRRHAHNRRPWLAQNVPVGDRSMRSVSAPVYIGGAHWGCVEIAFDPPDDPMQDAMAEIGAG